MKTQQVFGLCVIFMGLCSFTVLNVVYLHNKLERGQRPNQFALNKFQNVSFFFGTKKSSMKYSRANSLEKMIPALPAVALPEINHIQVPKQIFKLQNTSKNRVFEPLSSRLPTVNTFESSSSKSIVHSSQVSGTRVKVGICALSKSKKTWKTLDDSRIMQNVISSVYKTTVMEWNHYEITIFLGADDDDVFWLQHHVALKQLAMNQYSLSIKFHFYHTIDKFLPFNQLMSDAYRSGSEYLVRINDDSEFTSKGWISLGVNALKMFNPANVGVVGPTCLDGHIKILTHDMVHQTHLKIFKTYYPAVFHNWFVDDWITHVYGNERTRKIKDWIVVHHLDQQGQRYTEMSSDSKYIEPEIASGRNLIEAYVARQVIDTSKTSACSLKPGVQFLSQSNEDKAMFEKFYKHPLKCGGIIVEIGALDGLMYSNSYFFEKALGWQSVLVEANSQNAELLQRNRPNAITVHAAMCPEENVKFQGSGAVGGVLDSMSQKHKDAWIRKQDTVTTVPCRRWGPLFKEHGIIHIDIFVIDVEGGEYSVLSVMDWEVRVDYFIIEMSSSSSTETQQKIVSLLASKGYTPVSWSLKDWCTPGGDCTSNTVFSKSPRIFPVLQTMADIKLLEPQEGNNWIIDKIKQNKPFVAGRLGLNGAETCLLGQYLRGVKEMQPCGDAHHTSGIYPETPQGLREWAETYFGALIDMDKGDILASFGSEAEKFVFSRLSIPVLMKNRALEPFYFDNPWSSHLRGKTVLIIHPFQASIQCQLQRQPRKVLFPNSDVLPDFFVKFVKMPQASGTRTPHGSWLETLQYVKTQIDSQWPFDFVIISAAAYGMPLAVYCKKRHKASVVVMGGGGQLLFGLKGIRWDTHPVLSKLYNKHWIYALEEDTPHDALTIEMGGAYWGPKNKRLKTCPGTERKQNESVTVAGKHAVFIYGDSKAISKYKNNLNSFKCYVNTHPDYTLKIATTDDLRLHNGCTGTGLMFVRHCVLANYLEQHPNINNVLFLDADCAVLNMTRRFETFLVNNKDISFEIRFHNGEVSSGNYVVHNTAFSRDFLRGWAETQFQFNADNGALHQYLLERTGLADACSKQSTYEKFLHCFHAQVAGTCKHDLWQKHVTVWHPMHSFTYDGWLTQYRYGPRTFIHHANKNPPIGGNNNGRLFPDVLANHCRMPQGDPYRMGADEEARVLQDKFEKVARNWDKVSGLMESSCLLTRAHAEQKSTQIIAQVSAHAHIERKSTQAAAQRFQVHVLTMKRAKSLQRLLKSLQATEYEGSEVDLIIHVDHHADNQACIAAAQGFEFSHGSKKIDIASKNKGLRDSWFNAWRPNGITSEHAVILEDDIELSRDWYKWLTAAWNAYGSRDDLAGISLQRQAFVHKRGHQQFEIVNDHRPFLYASVGSIGFSPHWKQWHAFLQWIDKVDVSTVDIRTRDLVTSDWFYKSDKRQMWTQYFIWFCQQHKLFTLFVNLPDRKTLASHMREPGEHTPVNMQRDFFVADRVDTMNFPSALLKYDWDAKLISVSTMIKDGSDYGGWTYDASGLNSNSIVYSVGLGEDTSWDEGIMKRFGLRVWGFDPTPKSIEYVKTNSKLDKTKFFFTPEGLGTTDGRLKFTKPKNPNFVSMRQGVRDDGGEVIEVPVNKLENWMQQFQHSHIDILKLDIEGSEYDVLEDWISRQWFPMTQLLVEFHQRFFKDDKRHEEVLRGLLSNGFEILNSENNQEISFRRSSQITQSKNTLLNQQTKDFLSKASEIQKENGFVMIQLLNEGYAEMTKSWICNVHEFEGVLKSTLFVTTDTASFHQLREFHAGLNIVEISYNTPKEMSYGQYAYYNYMLFRTNLILLLLQNKITVWLTESDATWLSDPTDIILKTKGDYVTMSDFAPPGKMLQGGFQFLRPTPATISVWQKLRQKMQLKMQNTAIDSQMGDSGSEQLMLNNLISIEPNLKLEWLDYSLFAPGQYYSNQQYYKNPMVILNNWIVGNHAKIKRAQQWGHWYLSKDGKCKD